MTVSAYILIQCQPGAIEQVTEHLAQRLGLSGYITFGRYDLVIFCTVETPEALTKLLLNDLHPTNGIQRTETLLCTKPIFGKPEE